MTQLEVQKKSYDAACKEVLADRYILANILKECVSEFRAETIPYIAEQCIQGSPEIGTTPVRAGEDARLRMDGLSVEDSSLTESVIRYDIRFHAVLPRGGRPIKLIINVEAQNDFTPGYALLRRAMYYCCRLISSQYGTVFAHANYDAIEKVYSIWICTRPNEKWAYTITQYAMQEMNLHGEAHAPREEYDLIVPVMVCLGKKKYRELKGLLRLLNMVLLHRGEDDRDAIITELKEQFDVEMTPHLEKGVAEMCNLSEGVYRDGIEQGMEQGLQRGIEQGMERVRRETVVALLQEKMPPDLIGRVTKLSADKVRDIGKLHGFLE